MHRCVIAAALIVNSVCAAETEGLPAEPVDRVAGNLVQLTENGGWCWYQDPRALVDPESGLLIVGSVASGPGYDGAARDADVDVTSLALSSGRRQRVTLRNLPSYGGADDHNAPALWRRPDGRFLAVYTGHNDGTRVTRYRLSEPHDPSRWGEERAFDWGEALPGTSANVTYSNLLYLADEGRLYNVAREDQRSPNIAVSDDGGETWRYAGKLTVPRESVGYSNGYFRFASNGRDRIDFIATEHHPRDFNTSIYHGYIQHGRTYDSTGRMLDDDLFDERAPSVEGFTPVFLAEPESGEEVGYHRAWTTDLRYDGEGRPHVLFTTRYGTGRWPASAPDDARYRGSDDHRIFYARFDGERWRVTELAKMGRPLYPEEQDYTGLGALHPNDPSTVYISTAFDPRDGIEHPHREIFRGHTFDRGATWSWSPVTWASTVDNCRPIVPAWDGQHTALLWWRGTYTTQWDYDTAVVGIIDGPEELGPIHYVDATEQNTHSASGADLPGPGTGADAAGWRWRPSIGNGGSALTAETDGGTDVLVTSVQLPAAGTYELFVFLWLDDEEGDRDEDARLAAGLSMDERMVFRRRGCQQVDASSIAGTIATARSGASLYRAYLGRTSVGGAARVDVYLSGAGGAVAPYDGVAYARVHAP